MRVSKVVDVLAAGLALALAATACSGTRIRTQSPASPEASVTTSVTSSPSPEVTTSATAAPSPHVSPSPAAAAQLDCSAGNPPTGPGSVVATIGDTIARLSWTHQGGPGSGFMVGARVEVVRAGTTLLQTPVTAPAPEGQPSDQWASGWEGLWSVCVEVPATGLPLVHVRGYAGAMTCCGLVRTYYPRPDGIYATIDRSLGRGPGTFELSGGQVVLVASNADFNVKFDCGGCSPGPVQILTFADGRTIDITRRFPERIAAEADGWWKTIQGANPPALGLVAPWTADECELGRQTSAYATLDALNAAGKLVIPGQSPSPTPFFPEGSAFVAALKSFLKSEGYCS